MHAPPAVRYPAGRSRFALAVLALVWLAGVAATAAWSLQAAGPDWRHGLGAALVACCGVWAAQAWRRSVAGMLTWNGAGWQLARGPAEAQGRPQLALDLQSRLLLRWVPAQGPGCWLWVERDAAPADWDALRRAVYSRASAAPTATTPPPAER